MKKRKGKEKKERKERRKEKERTGKERKGKVMGKKKIHILLFIFNLRDENFIENRKRSETFDLLIVINKII